MSDYVKEKNLPEQKDSFKVVIVPSSDDEKDFENVGSFEEAEELSKGDKYCASIHEFDTYEEAKAFIKGYEAGVGYLGDGYWNADFNLEL